MSAAGDLGRARIGGLHAVELARFRHARPRSLAMAARARAYMPNGVPMAWLASDNDHLEVPEANPRGGVGSGQRCS